MCQLQRRSQEDFMYWVTSVLNHEQQLLGSRRSIQLGAALPLRSTKEERTAAVLHTRSGEVLIAGKSFIELHQICNWKESNLLATGKKKSTDQGMRKPLKRAAKRPC